MPTNTNDTGTAQETNFDELDFGSMSDEDILNMPLPNVMPEVEGTTETEEEDYDENESEEETNEEETDSDDQNEEEESSEEQDAFQDMDTEDEDTDTDEDDSTEEDAAEGSIDYKSKYEELMAPFRGNGKDVKVDSPEDLRRLAKMGVGFNAKMAAIKPIRRYAKMLENAGLLSEEKINYLIDLSNKDVSAINKLIKESGINPLDIDTESTDGYKPNTYTVDDNQLELDEALDDLERSSSGQRVIDLVSNKWDSKSKQVLVSNPDYLRLLHDQVSNGTYDQVMENVERERILGRIPNSVSDLDAYNFVGNQMAQAGLFNTPTTAPEKNQPNKALEDTKRNKRKRAAASPKGKKPATNQTDLNILDMSDEEFEKLATPKYI